MKRSPCRPVAGALAVLLSLLAWGAQAADAPAAGACRADARSLCSGVEPGGGRLLACLKQHEAQVSEGCKAALPTLERCGQEVQALCGAAGGARERRACLRQKATQLSAECRAVLPGR